MHYSPRNDRPLTEVRDEWFFINNLDPATTAEEVLTLIAEKTGITLGPEKIEPARKGRNERELSYLVKIPQTELAAILTWLLSETQLHGRTVLVRAPLQKSRAA